jgi:uncharacterized protein DUF4352
MNKTTLILFIGLVILSACSSPSGASATQATVTSSPPPDIATRIPTPSSSRDSITWGNLQVTMDQVEPSRDYITDYGSSRIPTEGNKFLWVHVRLKNTGQIEMDVPLPEHFSILYAAVELKPTYGHRAEYVDYTTLGPVVFPNQELEGWLRFDIPAAAELKDLRFVFLPESSQVGTSFSSPNYPYAKDKPTYVWKCQP